MRRTVEQVAARVDALIAMGDSDPEARHFEEDELVLEVLHSIITDSSNARELAWELLRTVGDEDVLRWWA